MMINILLKNQRNMNQACLAVRQAYRTQFKLLTFSRTEVRAYKMMRAYGSIERLSLNALRAENHKFKIDRIT